MTPSESTKIVDDREKEKAFHEITKERTISIKRYDGSYTEIQLLTLAQTDFQPKDISICGPTILDTSICPSITKKEITLFQQTLEILKSKTSLIKLSLDLTLTKETITPLIAFLGSVSTLLSLNLTVSLPEEGNAIDQEGQSIFFAGLQKSSVTHFRLDVLCNSSHWEPNTLFPLLRTYLPCSKVVALEINACRFKASAENFFLVNELLGSLTKLMLLNIDINNPGSPLTNIKELMNDSHDEEIKHFRNTLKQFTASLRRKKFPETEDCSRLITFYEREYLLENMTETVELLERIQTHYTALDTSERMLKTLISLKGSLQTIIALNQLYETISIHPSLQYIQNSSSFHGETSLCIYDRTSWDQIFSPFLPKALSNIVRDYCGPVKDARLTEYRMRLGFNSHSTEWGEKSLHLQLQEALNSKERWECPISEKELTPAPSITAKQSIASDVQSQALIPASTPVLSFSRGSYCSSRADNNAAAGTTPACEQTRPR